MLPRPITGAADVRSFFEATRAMYDTIAFKHEVTVESRTYLEWEGTFQGHSVAGMTVFTKDTAGLIESIRLYHRPYDMVIAFSTDLAGRLAGKMTVNPFFGSASGETPSSDQRPGHPVTRPARAVLLGPSRPMNSERQPIYRTLSFQHAGIGS